MKKFNKQTETAAIRITRTVLLAGLMLLSSCQGWLDDEPPKKDDAKKKEEVKKEKTQEEKDRERFAFLQEK